MFWKKHRPRCFWRCSKKAETSCSRCILAMFLLTILNELKNCSKFFEICDKLWQQCVYSNNLLTKILAWQAILYQRGINIVGHKSQSQLVWSFESQSRVKVKVVKWCRKKWFDHNQMYIYHKQCEILQKNHRNSSNIQFQWFPIEKGRKLCKRKRWNGWSKSIF